MLRKISSRAIATEKERLDALFAPVDGITALENLAAIDAHFERDMAERELRSQAKALHAAVKEHGLTPSLVAFANADGALEAMIGGDVKLAALESFGDADLSHMSGKVLSALEAYLEDEDSDDDSDDSGDDSDGEGDDDGKSGDDDGDGDAGDDGDKGSDDSDKGSDDGDTPATEHVIDELVAVGQYLASDAADIYKGVKFSVQNRGRVKIHGTPAEIEEHISQIHKGVAILLKICAMPIPKILHSGQKKEFTESLRAIAHDLESLGIEINEEGKLDSSQMFVDTKSTRTTKEDTEITPEFAKKTIEAQEALRKEVRNAVKRAYSVTQGWRALGKQFLGSAHYVVEYNHIIRTVTINIQRRFRQLTKAARSCKRAFGTGA